MLQKTVFLTTSITSDEETSLWRLDPKCFSSWVRLIRVHAWINRLISNSLEGEEHRTKGELTLNELSDTEKYNHRCPKEVYSMRNILFYKRDRSSHHTVKYLACAQR